MKFLLKFSDSFTFETEDLIVSETEDLILISNNIDKKAERIILQNAKSEHDLRESVSQIEENYFFVCLYKKSSHDLYVFNDCVGSNEIYIKNNAKETLISNSVYGLGVTEKDISLEKIYEQLAFNVINPPDTLYYNVTVVPTGYYCCPKSGGQHELKQFFDIKNLFLPKKNSYKELVSNFRKEFVDSLKRDISKPIGVALSGGIDSGGILSIISQKFNKKQVLSISMGPYGKDSGDLKSSRQTVRENESNNIEIYPEFEDLTKLVDTNTGLSQPVESMFIFSMGLIFEKAQRNDIDILYFGIGVDNMLGVSLHHKFMYYLETLEKIFTRSLLRPFYLLAIKLLKLNENRKRILLETDPAKRFLYLHSPLFIYESNNYLENVDPYKSKFKEHLLGILKNKKLGIIDRYIYADWLYYYTYTLNGAAYRVGGRFDVTALSNMYTPGVLNKLLKARNKHRKYNKWQKMVIRDMFKPFISERLYENRPKSCTIDCEAWFGGKEREIFEYLETNSLMRRVIDFSKLKKNFEFHPEKGLYLFRLLGLAVWFDANWDKGNLSNFYECLDAMR